MLFDLGEGVHDGDEFRVAPGGEVLERLALGGAGQFVGEAVSDLRGEVRAAEVVPPALEGGAEMVDEVTDASGAAASSPAPQLAARTSRAARTSW